MIRDRREVLKERIFFLHEYDGYFKDVSFVWSDGGLIFVKRGVPVLPPELFVTFEFILLLPNTHTRFSLF